MRSERFWLRGSVAALLTATVVTSCASRETSPPQLYVPLVAQAGEQIGEGTGSVPCASDDAASQQRAVQAALRAALNQAGKLYGDLPEDASISDLIVNQRVERAWQVQGQCFATVQAVVRTAELQKRARRQTRDTLAPLGRPMLAFAVSSYRILPNIGVTTRRAAAEVIDSLQQDLLERGFDIRRTLKGRRKALKEGGAEVADISSAERDEIAAAALKEGVSFLVQGEIKVSDEGKQPDGQYLAVVDGSLEAVDLKTERVVGGFRDVATAKHISASAAYTTAISGFAQRAAAEMAPQMLDSWQHAAARPSRMAETPR